MSKWVAHELYFFFSCSVVLDSSDLKKLFLLVNTPSTRHAGVPEKPPVGVSRRRTHDWCVGPFVAARQSNSLDTSDKRTKNVINNEPSVSLAVGGFGGVDTRPDTGEDESSGGVAMSQAHNCRTGSWDQHD